MRIPFRRGVEGSADELLDRAGEAIEDGRVAQGLRLLEDVRLAASRDGDDDEVLVAAWLMEAATRSESGDAAGAEHAARQALALDVDDPDAWQELADALYRQARFQESADALESMVERDPEDAGSWHLLGRVRTWLGDREGARAAHRRAHALDADEYVLPVHIAAAEFDRLAQWAWNEVPHSFRARLENALVVVAELPDADDVADGFDPDTLGVYEGATALEDGLPERIVLFQRNHEAVCASLGELREEIRRTVLHEVGHHFGMEDDELPY